MAERSENQLLLGQDVAEDEDEEVRVKRHTYEEAINFIGLGKFHVLLVFVCGWANATDSVEVACISLILTSLQCDMHVSSTELGWLTAVIFIGMMFGSYFWGSVGDLTGRKAVMMASLFVNGIFGFVSSFMPSFWLFFVFRFMSGVGVGGSIPVIWSYFSEFQPSRVRGRMLSLIATFWMFGQMITAGLAWILIPRTNLEWDVFGLEFKSWRLFLALSTFTCMTAVLLVLLLPDSPKFLLEKGKPEKALSILASVYQRNTGRARSEFPLVNSFLGRAFLKVKYLDTEEVGGSSRVPTRRGRGSSSLQRLLAQTGQLFHGPLLSTTLSMLIINFCMSFGSYGLTLWLPELFTRSREVGHNGSVCETSHGHVNSSLIFPPSTSITPNICRHPDSTVFRDTFLVALSSLPGNLFTIAFLDRVGRKPIFFVGAVVSGVSAFFVWFVSTHAEVLVVSCVFGGLSVVCWNCLDAFGTELFPTHLRSTALGACLATARIGAILGNLAFGALIDIHCAVPILFVAGMIGIAAIVSLKLKETTNSPLM